jgi:sterol desaturase/sphingolipid hydroxylase (fatty acid hydroxylase superfamily)
MQHTSADWNLPFVEKYLFIGAAGHRIHHSKDPQHYCKNLGHLVLWDWLFGTLHHEPNARVNVGITCDEALVHNSGKLKTELWDVYIQVFRVLVRRS